MATANSYSIDPGSRAYMALAVEAPYLEREREDALARRWRDQGDAEAMQELVTSYARFVVRVALGFRGYGLPLGDLIQEGNVGLMEAAARFDPERNVRFSTYAIWWVKSAIQEFILRNTSIVRIGTTAAQKSLFFNLRRVRAKAEQDDGGTMTEEARHSVARSLGVPVAAVERMEAHFTYGDQSLNLTVGSNDSVQRQDLLADDRPNTEDIVRDRHDSRARSDLLRRVLGTLAPREREIIVGRFLDEAPKTLAELGAVHGLSKERVRQIEGRALQKLRAVLDAETTEPRDLLDD